MTALVSRRMATMLEMFMPHVGNATVHTAVRHLAAGMGGFKAEDSVLAKDAASMLPLLHGFIKAVLPHCNKSFQAAFTDTTCLGRPLTPQIEAACEVLALAIKSFESAMEVTLRYDVQRVSDLSR